MSKVSSAAAAPELLDERPWSRLVSLEVAADATGASPDPVPIHHALVGTIVALRGGAPLVSYPGQPTPEPVPARTTVEMSPRRVGQQVVLLFEQGDPSRPIVTGCLCTDPGAPAETTVEIEADGERLTITARDRIVLRCGDASITLTSAGKVLLKGEYISQRSTGVIRIKGGAVEIN